MFKRFREEDGFTLIELLVVILIIGILILVAAPSFLGQQNKAYDSGVKQNLAVTYKDLKAYSAVNDGNFPSTAAAAAAAITASEPQLNVLGTDAGLAQGQLGVSSSTAGGVTVKGLSKSGTTFTMTASNSGYNIG